MDALKIIEQVRLVPVVILNKVEDTIPTLSAIIKGGVNVAEITFRTACAKECIALAAKTFPDAAIGAGTVLTREQALEAIEAGASFIVSPGFSESVHEVCKEKNVPYLPGVITPTEIMRCLDLGYHTLKFFPAGVFGGLKAIKNLGAVFAGVKFMPTGGVDNSNLKEFLDCDKILAVGGSWLSKGTPEQIEATCREAVRIKEGK